MHRRWWFFACWAVFIVGIIFLADIGRLSWVTAVVAKCPGSDKVGHFLLIGTLAYLFNQALRGKKVGPLLMGSLLVAIAITAEEFSQKWSPNRNFDYGDMAANLCGCIAADLLGRRCRKAGRMRSGE